MHQGNKLLPEPSELLGEACGLIMIIALMQTFNSYGPHEDNAGNLVCDI